MHAKGDVQVERRELIALICLDLHAWSVHGRVLIGHVNFKGLHPNAIATAPHSARYCGMYYSFIF